MRSGPPCHSARPSSLPRSTRTWPMCGTSSSARVSPRPSPWSPPASCSRSRGGAIRALHSCLRGMGPLVQASAESGITQATTEKPDIVLVDALLQGKTTGFDVAKRIRAASPGTRIVLVTVPQRPVDPRPELGIDAVFVLPGGANELASALGASKDAKREGGGQVIAVYSPKGGTGKTTIAVNLACVLRRNGASVA